MPTSTSIQNINTEVDFSSTAQTSLNNSRVRNLANKQSGAISFADCRWGISVPAIQTLVDPFGNPIGSWNKNYAISAETNLQALYSIAGQPPNEYSARAGVRILSNGTFKYFVGTFSDGDAEYSSLDGWLLVGSNSEYTIRLNTSDTLTVGTANTDLALTSNREFSIDAGLNNILEVTGDLILKRSGTTLITRPCYFRAETNNGI